MEIENLVAMANRIGEFFDSMSDRVEARQGIAQHISKFWEPRMRVALLNHIDSGASSNLQALVRDAVVENRAMLAVKNGLNQGQAQSTG
jgi:formate dehydrogenase subunit delta